ncbi:hypothetical protein KP509_04G065000 [Ceratopteris richardii]|nr:hypothetical protein KP509_04G065000 [Ceratopteris richardii]
MAHSHKSSADVSLPQKLSHSFDSYDLHVEIPSASELDLQKETKARSTHDAKNSEQSLPKEFAVCKATTACAGQQLSCPSSCLQGYYGGGYRYGGRGYGYGYGRRGYGYGHGGYGYGGRNGYGYRRGGYGYGRGGYGHGGYGYGHGGYGHGGYGGGWPSACKYDCLSGCKVSCSA